MTSERKPETTNPPAAEPKVQEPVAHYGVQPQRPPVTPHPTVEIDACVGSRFAQVMERASWVLGSASEALRWIARPALALDGHTPLALLQNPAGFEQVDDCLCRMEYGVYQ